MTDTRPAAESPGSPGLIARIVGIVFSPRRTYTAVAARPRVAGVLVATLLISSGSQLWLFSTEPGRQAMRTEFQSVGRASAQGEVTAEQRQVLELIVRYVGVAFAVVQIIFGPMFLALFAVILKGICNALFDGARSFRQLFAVVAHSNVIPTVVTLFHAPLIYAKEELASPTKLGVMLPMLPEEGLASFVGWLDLLWIWWCVNLAIGLGALYARRTAPIAATFLSLYGGIGLLVVILRTLFQGRT